LLYIPDLAKQFCPSSTKANEQINRLLLCDIPVLSPDILILILSSCPPSLFFSCNNIGNCNICIGLTGQLMAIQTCVNTHRKTKFDNYCCEMGNTYVLSNFFFCTLGHSWSSGNFPFAVQCPCTAFNNVCFGSSGCVCVSSWYPSNEMENQSTK